MDKKEMRELLTYIKNKHPYWYYLNQKTEISNVLFYKLIKMAEELLESKN